MDYLGYAISAASGGGGGGSSFDPLLIDSDLVPTDTATYDVGRPLKRWRNGEFTAVNSVTVIAPTVTVATIASNDPTVNVTSLNGVTANKFTVNGGTDQQYLMGDGSLLKYSANSGNSNFYLYNSSQVITAPPPSGFIRYNNIVQDNATQIYISHLTRDNIDIDVFFNQITTITEVYIQDQNSSDNFIQYNVLATPSITPNSYVTLSVSKRSSNGTGSSQFPNGHNIILSFFTNGIEVDSRLTTLETKTQNQTASTTTTTFTGTGGIVATKHIVPSGLTSQFLKANGDLDSSSYVTIASADTTYLALTGGNLTGALSGTTFTGSSLFCPSLDTVSPVGLAIGATTQTGLTLGRVGATTNLRGLSVVTTGNITPATTNVGTIGTSALLYNNGFFTALSTASIDTATAVAQNIGTVTQTALTLGRVGATTNLRGLSIVTTGNITPATTNVGTIGTSALLYNNGFFTALSTPTLDTATAVAQNIGILTQTALTVGRVGANTLVNGLVSCINAVTCLNLGGVPFISQSTAVSGAPQPKLMVGRFIMPTSVAQSSTGTFVASSVAGSMGGVSTQTGIDLQVVGSTWRYQFSGAVTLAGANNISFQVVHAGGTQTMVTWTYTTATTSQNFNGCIVVFWSVVGTTATANITGYVNYVNGTTLSVQNVATTFANYNSTVSNANTCQFVGGAGVTYGIQNFSLEWLR